MNQTAKNYARLLKNKVARLYKNSPLELMLRPRRRFQAYCVGTGKSGTHSVAALFKSQYRSAHEPESRLVIETILGAADGYINTREVRQFIKQQDKRLWLELNSSNLNYFFLDYLIQDFPKSRFILTIRDCYSWLDSFINQQLASPGAEIWSQLRDFRFKRNELQYSKEEKLLADLGLYTLDGYLSYWAKHNKEVLAAVPSDRLLVVRTSEITKYVKKIADFLRIPVDTLNFSKSHSYKGQKKYGVLLKIDRQFLEDKIHLHCRYLMERYFPEVKSLEDSIKKL